MRFVTDFNDKYGPKYVSKTEAVDGTGKHYVLEYTRNVFGNRPIDADAYSYYDQKRIKRTNRRKQKRANRK